MAIVNPQRAAVDAVLWEFGVPPKPRPETLARPLQELQAAPERFGLLNFRLRHWHLVPAGVSGSSMPGSAYPDVNVLVLVDIKDEGKPFVDVEAIQRCPFTVFLREATPRESRRDLGAEVPNARCVQMLAVVLGMGGVIVHCVPTRYTRAYPPI